MSKLLAVITEKLTDLNDRCTGVNAEICFECGHIDPAQAPSSIGFVELPVPPTVVGRELLRALLIEIGRDEQNKIKSRSLIFDAVVEGPLMPTV